MATTTTAPTVDPAKKPYDPLTDAIGNEFTSTQSVGTGIPAPPPVEGPISYEPNAGAPTTQKTGMTAPSAADISTPPTTDRTAGGTTDIYGMPLGTEPNAGAPTTQKTGMTAPSAADISTPPTPEGAPVQIPTQPIDPNIALNQIGHYFQSKYGRPMTEAEKTQLIAASGYTSGLVTPEQFRAAMQAIDQYGGGNKAGTPGTGGVNPLPGTRPDSLDPNAAMNTAKQAFQAKFGRAMTAAELQQLITALGLQPGQPITQADIDRALAIIAGYSLPGAGGPGTGGPGTGGPGTEGPGGPGTPAGSIDPNVALNNVKTAFQTKFGRAITQKEIDALLTYLGYTGGPVTAEMMAKALDAVSKYSGKIDDPWGTPAPGEGGGEGEGEGEEEETEAERLARLRLEELLGTGWGSVDPNDPALSGQMDANQLDQQRSTNRKRAALAERAAARGGINAGGFDVDQERLLQEQGESEQQFNANLYAKELEGQRERLMEGIKIATDLGLAQDAQRLQEELARLELSIKEYLGKGQLSLGMLEAIMNDRRFYDELGFNMAKFLEYLNTQAVGSMFA